MSTVVNILAVIGGLCLLVCLGVLAAAIRLERSQRKWHKEHWSGDEEA